MGAENHHNVTHSRKEIIANNFLGGIAWGVGSAIGATILIALLGLLFSRLDYVPVIGDIVSEVTSYVESRNAFQNSP